MLKFLTTGHSILWTGHVCVYVCMGVCDEVQCKRTVPKECCLLATSQCIPIILFFSIFLFFKNLSYLIQNFSLGHRYTLQFIVQVLVNHTSLWTHFPLLLLSVDLMYRSDSGQLKQQKQMNMDEITIPVKDSKFLLWTFNICCFIFASFLKKIYCTLV